jgi:inner membrane protein
MAPIAANSLTRRRRIVLVACLFALTLAPAWFGMIPVGAIAAISAISAILALATRRVAPRARSATALAAVTLFVASMFGLSHLARGLSLVSVGTDSPGEIVDVILNPKPGVPLCWDAVAIEKNESSGEYILRRGTLALFDGWLPMRSCDSEPRETTALGASRSGVVWSEPLRESLERLRALSRDDCWVRAWLQFGRAPTLGDQDIADFRFGGRARSNFTAMQLRPPTAAKVCPPNLTDWGLPRADLLDGGLGH